MSSNTKKIIKFIFFFIIWMTTWYFVQWVVNKVIPQKVLPTLNPGSMYTWASQTWDTNVSPSLSWITANTWTFTRTEYLKNLSWTGFTSIEQKVNYVLSFGEPWNDFTTIIPHSQNLILWATKESNNILIQSYVQKYQNTLILDKNRKWFLVIKTQRRIPNDKDLILAINGKRLWSVHKEVSRNKFKSDISDNHLDTLYIFELNSIDIAQHPQPVNLYSYDPLNISLVIWENNNSITSISIVYIN